MTDGKEPEGDRHMNAPDRIWAMPSDDGWMAPYCGNAPHDGSTEYVRADLCDLMQDERVKRLVEALDEIAGVGFDAPMTWADTDHQWDRNRANVMQRIARAALRDMGVE